MNKSLEVGAADGPYPGAWYVPLTPLLLTFFFLFSARVLAVTINKTRVKVIL